MDWRSKVPGLFKLAMLSSARPSGAGLWKIANLPSSKPSAASARRTARPENFSPALIRRTASI